MPFFRPPRVGGGGSSGAAPEPIGFPGGNRPLGEKPTPFVIPIGGSGSSGSAGSGSLSRPTRQTLLEEGPDALMGLADFIQPSDSDEPGSDSNLRCLLDGAIFDAAGYLPIFDNSSSVRPLRDLSWTVATNATAGSDDGTIAVQREFYLGTSPGVELTGLGGCALFFGEVSDDVHFGEGKDGDDDGGCRKALSPACVDAITARAIDIDMRRSTGEVCAALLDEFQRFIAGECFPFAKGQQWSGLHVEELFSTAAPQPIPALQKSSSSCWPVANKNNDLTRVSSQLVTGNNNTRFLLDTEFQTTPILTLLFPGNSSVVSQPEVHMTCIKPMRREAETSITVGDDYTDDSGDCNGGCGGGNLVESRGVNWRTPSVRAVLGLISLAAMMAEL